MEQSDASRFPCRERQFDFRRCEAAVSSRHDDCPGDMFAGLINDVKFEIFESQNSGFHHAQIIGRALVGPAALVIFCNVVAE